MTKQELLENPIYIDASIYMKKLIEWSFDKGHKNPFCVAFAIAIKHKRSGVQTAKTEKAIRKRLSKSQS